MLREVSDPILRNKLRLLYLDMRFKRERLGLGNSQSEKCTGKVENYVICNKCKKRYEVENTRLVKHSVSSKRYYRMCLLCIESGEYFHIKEQC